jgi:hypothetical protein
MNYMFDNRSILYQNGLFEIFDKINNCLRQIPLAQAKELAQNDTEIAAELADIESTLPAQVTQDVQSTG